VFDLLNSEKNQTRFILILLFALALGYVVNAPHTSGGIDSVEILYLVRDSLNAEQIPLHGIINSRAAFNPPHLVWLYVIPSLFSNDITMLGVPSLILHLISLFLVYRLARRYFGFYTALIAVLLYATN
jgi:Gpi18-like mannosyltransferase